jgi:hypothetical protein
MSFDLKASLSWAKSHPWETGGLVFIVIAGAFILLRGGGGGSSGSAQASLGQYLSAQTAQNASDNSTTAYLASLKGATEVAGINAKQASDVANTWASATVAANASDNDAAQKVGVLAYLGQLANNLGTVIKSSSASQSGKGGGLNLGFDGFSLGFSSNKSSANSATKETLIANSQQELAATTLRDIADGLFHPGH